MIDQEAAKAIFAPLAAAIREDQYKLSDIFNLLGIAAEQAPGLARLFGLHIADYLESVNNIVPADPSELLVYAYWMALFDATGVDKYGADPFDGDLDRAKEYVVGALHIRAMQKDEVARGAHPESSTLN